MTASIKIRQSIILLSFIFVFLTVLLGLLYLKNVNNLATKGYEIKAKEEKLENFRAQNQRLKIELAKVRRLDSLDEFAKSQNLVKIKKASFLSAPGELVAKQ